MRMFSSSPNVNKHSACAPVCRLATYRLPSFPPCAISPDSVHLLIYGSDVFYFFTITVCFSVIYDVIELIESIQLFRFSNRSLRKKLLILVVVRNSVMYCGATWRDRWIKSSVGKFIPFYGMLAYIRHDSTVEIDANPDDDFGRLYNFRIIAILGESGTTSEKFPFIY